MINNHVALLVGVLSLLLGPVVGQDVVRLKTGALLEGTIIEQDETSVTIAFEGGSMALQRTQIAEIKVSRSPDRAATKKALLTLSRFPDHQSFHFLYRDGRRVGYRTIEMRREAKDGVPGYTLMDRLVFLPRAGATPDVDLAVSEFVDAELRPIRFQHRMSSGTSGRVVEGSREGLSLVMKERLGGALNESTALFRKDVQFPGMLLRRLASEPPPEGAYPQFTMFRPREVDFGRMSLRRRIERVSLRGRVRDVLVFRRQEGDRELETWLDMSGHVVREELGSTHLVSLRAPKAEVLGYARGEEIEGGDLGLEFIHEPSGFRVLRPDLAWEVTPGAREGAIVSMLRPGMRATIDVLRIDDVAKDATEEGVAMRVLARMERHADDIRIEGPYPTRLGARKALRFEVECMRRGTRLKTLGAIVLDGRGHGFVILCAAPELDFVTAKPSFIEMLDTIRILEDAGETSNPFAIASDGVDAGN